MIKSQSALALASLSLLTSMWVAGCAQHADVVLLRKELRASTREQAKAQDEARQQRSEMEQRLQALELQKESGNLQQRVEELTVQVKTLERRLARVEERLETPTTYVPKSGPPFADSPERARPVQPVPSPQEEAPVARAQGISPTAAFNLAYNDYLQGRYDLSVVGFERFLRDFPSASLVPTARYWLGESYYQKHDYVRAMHAFERLVADHPDHVKTSAALYKIGLAAAETGDDAKAGEYLKRVIEEHATSNEARLARNKLAELR